MSPFVLKSIIIVSTFLYAATLLLWCMKKPKLSRCVWLVAGACSFVIVVNNFVVNHYVPFVSMYQILTFSALLFSIVYFYLHVFRHGAWMAPYFSGCSLLVSIGLCFMDAQAVWHFPPALNSPWFIPHILLYVIAYILAAVTFLMMLSKYCVKKEVCSLSRIDSGIYDCVCILFPCMTMGMFFGALWANEVWGGFWSWDIKEIWALVTWLVWMCWLHFRRSKNLRRYSDILIALGFVCVIVTFFFVRIMANSGSSMHTYS